MQVLICGNCKHYIGEQKCTAFPEGIPDVITLGENDHEKPLPDQIDDIVFEQKEPDEN